jgi:hypothetical protein
MTTHEEIQDHKGSEARKAECARCGGVRNCDIRGEYFVTEFDDQVQAWKAWYILECRGCEYVFIQTVGTFSEDYDHDEHGEIEYNETIEYWPARSKREMPKWLDHGLDAQYRLRSAMAELYRALDNDLHMLAGIGIRTVFDIASEQLGIDPELPFVQKLESLVSKGSIESVNKDRLEMLIEVGNATVHRGVCPTPVELRTMMDVLEHFIEGSFIAPEYKRKLDAEAAAIKARVPSRPKRVRVSQAGVKDQPP